MTQVDISKVVYHSSFPGLGNPTTSNLSYSVPSKTVSISSPIYSQTNNLAVGSSSDIVSVRMQLTGLDSNWYLLAGSIDLLYNSSNVHIYTPLTSWAYDVSLSYRFSGGDMVVFTAINLGGFLSGPFTVPAFTVNITLNRYATPF